MTGAVRPKNIEAVYSVSEAQAARLAVRGHPLVSTRFDVHGPLDDSVFAAAWAHVASGITALRSFFVDPPGEATAQIVTRDAARALVRADAQVVSATAFSVTLTRHPAVLDDRSAGVVIEVLVRSYDALRAGRPLPAIDARRPAEYATWRNPPASYGQERLWFLQQFEGELPAYHAQSAISVTGELRIDVLQASLDAIVRRHESLRTSFRVEGDALVQVIGAPFRVPFETIDVRDRPGDVDECIRADNARPFDLADGPLLRLTLLRTGERETIVLVTIHHIVIDGWSRGIFLKELTALYAAFAAGAPSPLAPLELQYADYAVRQRAEIGGAAWSASLNYWKTNLAGSPPASVLPADVPRSTAGPWRGERCSRTLSANLSAAIARCARDNGATTYMVLLAALQLVVARTSGGYDVVIGTPSANRAAPEIEPLIGFFVNALPLRTDVSGNPSFLELLERVAGTALNAYAHQNVPFEKLVEELAPQRDAARNPFFQIFLNMLNVPQETLVLAGLEVRDYPISELPNRFDLTLYAQAVGEQVRFEMVYDAALYSRATAERALAQLENVLAEATAAPHAGVEGLSLGASPHAAPQHPKYADHGPIHHAFVEQAARTPHRLAVRDASGELTYAELDLCSNRIANWLRAAGCRIGDAVAVFANPGAGFVASLLGVLKAGAAFAVLDPALPQTRLRAITAAAQPAFIVVPGASDPASCGVERPVLRVPSTAELATGGFLRDQPDAAPAIDLTGRSAAYVVFTSGTTGAPLGIRGNHGAVSHFLDVYRRTYDVTADDRFAFLSGPAHDPALRDIFAPLSLGASLHIPTPTTREAGSKLKAWLNEEQVTIAHLTPAMSDLLSHPDVLSVIPSGVEGQPLSQLRRVFFGGDRLTYNHLQRLQRVAPNCRFVNFYGTTETPQAMTAYAVEPATIAQQPGAALVPIGHAIEGVCVEVRNDAGNACAPGELGEIHIRTPYLADGYLNPECAPDRFVGLWPEGAYRTGDLARVRDDGTIEFAGRRDAQVKLRGFRVEPAELEALLAGDPRVSAAAAIASDRDGETQLDAFVVARAGASADPHELRRDLANRVPAYMLPARIVVLDAIPLTANGKRDRAALLARLPAASIANAPPHGTIAIELAAIWRDVLGCAHVGNEDDFFALGGHSLKAVRVAARVARAFGVELPLRAFFAHPRLCDLAAQIRRAKPAVSSAIVPVPHAPWYAASHAQRRLWSLSRLDPTAYNMQRAVLLEGHLDEAALTAAFALIALRHEALRTTFAMVDDDLVQIVAAAGDVPIRRVDLRAEGDAEEAARTFAREDARSAFALDEAPPFRVALLRLDTERHVLVFSAHHIIADGWSLGVLVREFSVAYDALRAAVVPELAALRVQYKDFSAWQRALLEGAAGAAHRAYWLERLAAPLPVLDLPADFPRPPDKSGAGIRVPLRIDAECTAALAALARANGASLYMVLLALVKAFLFRLAGEPDVIVGCPVAGRSHADLEDQFGCYVNMLALRDRVDADVSFASFVRAVAATASEAFEHAEYPFDRLVAELAIARDVTRSPLFDVVAVLQNTERTELQLEGLSIAPFETPVTTSKFDCTFTFEERDGAVDGVIDLNADLFVPDRAERMAREFEQLATSAAADPERRIAALHLVPQPEQRAIAGFNHAAFGYPAAETIVSLFERVVAADPDAPAVTGDSGVLTYAELNGRANALARTLRDLYGVAAGDRVGVLMERSPLLPAAILAILKAGAAYVPVDPAYPAERIAFTLGDAACRAVVSDAHNTGALREYFSGAVLDTGNVDAPVAANLDLAPDPEDAAYVIYTSGSTGRPKGCEVTHRNVVRLLKNDGFPFDFHARDTWAMAHSAAFDFSVWEMFGALLNGARLAIVPRDVVRNPVAFRNFLRRHRVTVLNSTPAAFEVLAEVECAAAERDLDRHLRYVIFGGDRLSPMRLRDWAALYPLERVRLVNMYGITETTVHVTVCELTQAHIAGAFGPSPIGVPLPETRVYVCDAAMQLQPIGVAGELYVGGSGVCRGYLNRPELTAERFIASPFVPGEMLYRSGDVGRWRDGGTLEYLGRNDAQVQVRGFRVELDEVRRTLESAPGVRAAVVDAVAGDLIAWIVPFGDAPATLHATIRDHVRAMLPDYMLPAHLIAIDDIPLTGNGKVDRARLPQPADAPAAAGAAPGGSIEARIAGIWRAVLPRTDFGLDDNFFDAGGHSLLLIRVHRSLQQAIERDVPLVELFRYPTIRGLAAYLRDAGTVDAVPAVSPALATAREDIAIIGMAGRFPGAADVDAFWSNLRNGVESTTELSDEMLLAAGSSAQVIADSRYVRNKPVLDGIEEFDAEFFGISDREAAVMDPQHRIFLESAWTALERAGYDPKAYAGRIGVYAAVGFGSYLFTNLYGNAGLIESLGAYSVLIGNDRDYVATRTSYKLDLRGPSLVVGAACSGSMVAVNLACESLQSGACEMALAGGVSITVPQHEGYLYDEGGILSADGHCRAFDARAGGTVGASGAGIVVLKRLSDALRDGDHVAAVIRGIAASNDGADKVGYTAPSVGGQTAAIARAQELAGVDPRTIDVVEAHGTGTTLGDPIEIAALAAVFRERTADANFCAIGSVKTNVGHLSAAAGVAGLIKTVLALEHREIPPSLNFEQPNAQIDFAASPFFVNTRLRAWERRDHPRRAGVSSFGLGGTNVHAVLEEAADRARAQTPAGEQLLRLSAPSAAQLDALTSNLAAHFANDTSIDIADAAHTLAIGRRAFAYRRVLLAEDAGGAVLALRGGDPRTVFTSVASETRKVAFLFPGGGAQYAGMGRDLYAGDPVFRAAFDRCGQRLDLHDEASMRRPAIALPALFAVEYALAQSLLARGVEPDAMIGHSQGEYVAAVLAGVLSLDDALALVAFRGALFERTARGAMLGVPLPEAAVSPLLNAELSLAAVNLPDACVVSGTNAAVEALERRLAGENVETRRLHIDVAAHSALLDPVLDEFYAFVKTLRFAPPSRRFVSSLTGTWITDREATDPRYWTDHLRHTVRFAGGLRELTSDSTLLLLEVGPGNTLASLAQRHPDRRDEQPVLSTMRRPDDRAQTDRGAFLTALGRMWTFGCNVDTRFGTAPDEARRIPLPGLAFARKRHWIDRVEGPVPVAARKADVRTWFSTPSPRRAPLTAAMLERGRWLIYADAGGVGAAVAARLRALGNDVHDITGRAEDADVRDGDRVLFAAALDGAEKLDAFVELSRTCARRVPAGRVRIVVLTSGAQDVTGDDGLVPANAVFHGPALVSGQEHSALRCRTIDIAPGDDRTRTVAQLERDLSSASDDAFAAYRGPHRWVRDFAPLALTERPSRLRHRGVYLITGGTGGVGICIARFLARESAARLLLVSRSGELSDATRHEIESLGGEVRVLRGDVADAPDMRRAVAEARGFYGSLDGVVHAAGITTGDSIFEPLETLGAYAFSEQLRPKLAGAEALAAVLQNAPLDFVLLISSNASIIGGLGLAAYASANACLDAFASAQDRASDVPWISTSWDGWPTARRAAFDPAERTSQDALAMSEAEAQDALRLVLRAPAGHVIVSAGDLQARVERWTRAFEPAVSMAVVEADAPQTGGDPVAATLAALWREMLGAVHVGPYDNFFELRGDSLLGSRMITRINLALGVHLPLRALFEAPTVAGLAERIHALREVAAPATGEFELVI